MLHTKNTKMTTMDWNKKRLELMGMSRLIDGETTMEELKDLCADRWRLPRDCNEVYPKLYVGSEQAGKDPALLKSLGITHVVNAACLEVKTGDIFYMTQGVKVALLQLEINDTYTYNIAKHFEEVNRFIEVALHSRGKVLIHGKDGISRSATLAIAYLMMRRGLCALEAVRTVRKKRHVLPNDGFLRQIVELDAKIRKDF